VEQSIRDLQAPLSLARSRLVIRANKSSVEVRRGSLSDQQRV
jgi:hypothetical protein